MRWPFFRAAVDDAHQHDHAEIGVIPAVDQQGLERRLGVALGRRQARHDRLQHGLDVLAGLGRDRDGVRGVESDHLLDLLLDAVGIGSRQVDLVEDGQDLEIVVERLVDVGERLRLHPLARIDDQHGALASRQRAGDLVGEVDVARRVHQVELIGLAVLGAVVEAHGLRLDGDAALALDVHRVEDLLLHLPVGDVAAQLDEPVGERRLAMVDVSDDREVADQVDIRHGPVLSIARRQVEHRTARALRIAGSRARRARSILRNCILTDSPRIRQVWHSRSSRMWHTVRSLRIAQV